MFLPHDVQLPVSKISLALPARYESLFAGNGNLLFAGLGGNDELAVLVPSPEQNVFDPPAIESFDFRAVVIGEVGILLD